MSSSNLKMIHNAACNFYTTLPTTKTSIKIIQDSTPAICAYEIVDNSKKDPTPTNSNENMPGTGNNMHVWMPDNDYYSEDLLMWINKGYENVTRYDQHVEWIQEQVNS